MTNYYCYLWNGEQTQANILIDGNYLLLPGQTLPRKIFQ